MKENNQTFLDICIKRGFFMPSFEIYGGVSGFYDYGPIGHKIKLKIIEKFRQVFFKKTGFLEISTNSICPEIVFRASGHLENFDDPVLKCSKCQEITRADKFLEKKYNKNFDGLKNEEYDKLILDNNFVCEKCNSPFLKTSRFNLMFNTRISNSINAYLRPETAQNIFMNFKRINKLYGENLPMGIGQIGKAYRNEISPRNGLIRLREFEQMELEYFYNPNQEFNNEDEILDLIITFKDKNQNIYVDNIKNLLKNKIIEDKLTAYFLSKEMLFFNLIGLNNNIVRFRELTDIERPHYSSKNIDVEIDLNFGLTELLGNAKRTNFDLKSHSKISGKKIEVFSQEEKINLIPFVFEVSMGLDRLFWSVLEKSFKNKNELKEWDWFDFPIELAPYMVAVFPLVKKEQIIDISKKINNNFLENNIDCFYNFSGNIGKRYARADEIGIPYCITVDYQTIEDDTVTIRFRNSARQERIKISEIINKLNEYKDKNIVE